MKKLFATFALALLTTSAFAATAKLSIRGLRGLQETKDGYVYYTVEFKEDGKISIASNNAPNLVEEAIIIEDRRPMDGNLKLQVGKYVLVVGSGYNIEGIVNYSLQIGEVSIDLQPITNVNIEETQKDSEKGGRYLESWH